MSSPRNPFPPRHSWSLVTRLTIHHTLLTFVVLAVSSAILYWGLISSLSRRNSEYLNSVIRAYSSVIKTEQDQSVLRKEIVFDHVASEYITSYARVIDSAGKILMETPHMGQLLPPDRFPSAEPVDSFSPKVRRWISSAGNLYVMKSVWVMPEYTGGDPRFLQVALEISRAQKIRDEYLRKLLLVLFFGTFVSCLAGVVVARRGLEPLEKVVKTAERIDVGNLSERIDPTRFPLELKALACAFDRMLDRLKDSFDSLSHYANQLAHEIRTPITVMTGEAEIALSTPRTADEYREVIESSVEEMHRLSRLIDSLLFIVRCEKREIQPNMEDFDACAQITEVVEYYEALAESRQITIHCEGESRITADRSLFRRALGNVISNAIYFTPASGEILIHVSIHTRSTDISVTDTGCGISPAEIPKVFNNFYRIDETAHLHPTGLGLGLSIVKAIMDLHKGSVTIAPHQPTGTRVTLSFPQLLS